MSEQELNSILEEIKNRGKAVGEGSSQSKEPEINFNFNSAEQADSSEVNEAVGESEATPAPSLVLDEVEDAISDFSLTKQEAQEPEQDEYEELEAEGKKPVDKKKLIIIGAIVAVIVVAVVVACVIASQSRKKPEAPVTNPPAVEQQVVEDDVVIDNTNKNPLTGEGGYNKNALGKRPIAVVVENEYSTSSVRPQWGLSEADIVLEGESEFSTRLLLFWADYTNVPKQVGPARSARPPFIRFSELFDAVFIHAGFSHSRGNYVGADSVFANDNVDHVNLLQTSGDGTYFGRDKSRTSTVEHTGYLNGTNVPKMLEAYKISTDFKPESFTQLSFNEIAQNVGTATAKSITFKWGGNCPKTGSFSYDENSKAYTTTDFDSQFGSANVKWENLVFLLDQTTYVVKHNYKGSQTETYCDYSLSGGRGTIASNGTAVEIKWGVTNKKLWFKDVNGNEIKLNPGKTYIGYGSENHGGSVTIE